MSDELKDFRYYADRTEALEIAMYSDELTYEDGELVKAIAAEYRELANRAMTDNDSRLHWKREYYSD
jgi:hypothetical protein